MADAQRAPCLLERLPIRSPGDVFVRDVNPAQDGFIVIEGLPGLIATFGHVEPAPGLTAGTSVRAGDVIAHMTYEHGFDFGVSNPGMEEPRYFLNTERYVGISFAQSPIVQLPEPLRSQMITLVQKQADPLGRLSYDVPGTASGYWFREGTPVAESFCFCQVESHLFLGTLQEREDIQIMNVGGGWPRQPNTMLVFDGSPDNGFPHGAVLMDVMDGQRLRLERFDTHEEVSSFTPAARIYER